MILHYDFGDDDNWCEYEFEIDYRDIRDYLNTCEKANLIDCIMEEASAEDYFEDEIHDYFRDAAYEAFRDAEEYNKDPYAYYGVKRKDFF